MNGDISCGTPDKLEELRISPRRADGTDQEEALLDSDQDVESNSEADEDDEDEEEEEVDAELGFVEKPKNSWSLLRQYLPSKAGGTPAWLDPINLPSGGSSLCGICGTPLRFMLQVYAPIGKDSAFHRTLFLFMCPSMSCLRKDQHEQWKREQDKASRSVKVFRSQLPKVNPYYSENPPKDDGTARPSPGGALLCSWCCTWRGDKVCSDCKKERYCSKKHQTDHWRTGHGVECKRLKLLLEVPACNNGNSKEIQRVAGKDIWPEYEIVIDDEPKIDDDITDANGYAKALIPGSSGDAVKSMPSGLEGDDDRKSWVSFEERISRATDQVLRYRGNAKAKPLWPMSSGRPSRNDIPNCRYCHGPQNFEFQVMPQLLNYFNVENEVGSLDWATIVVYTCEASCDDSLAYKEEFPWVQLLSQSAST